MADHHIQFTLEPDNYGRVDAEVVCFAAQDAPCHAAFLALRPVADGAVPDHLALPHPGDTSERTRPRERISMLRPERSNLLTAQDAADAAGVTRETLRDWTRRGILPRYGSPRCALYAWEDLAKAKFAAKPRRRVEDRCA